MGRAANLVHSGRMIFALTVVILLFGCREGAPAEDRAFFELPLQQRHEKFRTLPVEKQLELYFYAVQRHPPDYGFANDIAQRGEGIIPLLVERLKREKDESKQRDIIYIFKALADEGGLSNRQEVITLIEQVTFAMKPGVARDESYNLLRDVKRQSDMTQHGAN